MRFSQGEVPRQVNVVSPHPLDSLVDGIGLHPFDSSPFRQGVRPTRARGERLEAGEVGVRCGLEGGRSCGCCHKCGVEIEGVEVGLSEARVSEARIAYQKSSIFMGYLVIETLSELVNRTHRVQSHL